MGDKSNISLKTQNDLDRVYFSQMGGGCDEKFKYFPPDLSMFDNVEPISQLFTQKTYAVNPNQKRYVEFEQSINLMKGGNLNEPLFKQVSEPFVNENTTSNVGNIQTGGEFSDTSSSNDSEFERIRNYIMSNNKQNGGSGETTVLKLGIETPTPDSTQFKKNNEPEINTMKGGSSRDNGDNNDGYGDDNNDGELQYEYQGTYTRMNGGAEDDLEADLEEADTEADTDEDSFDGMIGGGRKKKTKKKKSKRKAVETESESSNNIFDVHSDSDYGNVNVIPFYSSDSSHDYSFKHPFNRNRFN